MIFLEFMLELMMILMFLTGAGVLDDVMDLLRFSCFLSKNSVF